MKIAQVSPLYESVPPEGYGGTERVVSYLTEELVRMGHGVTLYASGGSDTAARLVPCADRGLRLDPGCADPIARHLVMFERIARDSGEFDLIHVHADYIAFPAARRFRAPVLFTIHGRQDGPETSLLYREYADMPLVSISDAQRAPVPSANWVATVYHGLPEDLYAPGAGQGGYLAFVGRFSPEKRVDAAIDLAVASGIPLKIAAKINALEREYFDTVIRPKMENPLVEYVGEIGGKEKADFLGNAYALLFPVEWPEPFGLAMIEAMACGTPVIARRCGSIPEIVEHGVTGFVFETDREALEGIRKAWTLGRRTVRKVFEQRFSVSRMTADYVGVYDRIVRGRRRERGARPRAVAEAAPLVDAGLDLPSVGTGGATTNG